MIVPEVGGKYISKYEKERKSMRTLEVARAEDIQRCVEIIDMGRRFQRARGFVQ